MKIREEIENIIADEIDHNMGSNGQAIDKLVALFKAERERFIKKEIIGKLSKADLERITVQSSIDQMEAHEERIRQEEREQLIERLNYWAETLDVDKEFENLTHFENGFDHFRIKLQKKLDDIKQMIGGGI